MGIELSVALTRMRADFGMPVEAMEVSFIDRSAIALDRPDGSVLAVTNFSAYPPFPYVDACMANIISDRLVERLGYKADSVTPDIELLRNLELRNLKIEYTGGKPAEFDINAAVEQAKKDIIDKKILPNLQIAMMNPGTVLQSIIAGSIMSGEYFIDVPGIYDMGRGQSNPATAKFKMADGSSMAMEDVLKTAATADERTHILLYTSSVMLNYMETFIFEPDETRQKSLDAMGPHTRNTFFEILCSANLVTEGHAIHRDDILMPGFTKKYSVAAFREGRANLRTLFGSGRIFYPVITSVEDQDKRTRRQAMGVLIETPSAKTLPLYLKALDMLMDVRTIDVNANMEAVFEGCRAAVRSMHQVIGEEALINALMDAGRQANMIRALVFLERKYPGAHDRFLKTHALDLLKKIEQRRDQIKIPLDQRSLGQIGDRLLLLEMLLSITTIDVKKEINEIEGICYKAIRDTLKYRKAVKHGQNISRVTYENMADMCGPAMPLCSRYFRNKAAKEAD